MKTDNSKISNEDCMYTITKCDIIKYSQNRSLNVIFTLTSFILCLLLFFANYLLGGSIRTSIHDKTNSFNIVLAIYVSFNIFSLLIAHFNRISKSLDNVVIVTCLTLTCCTIGIHSMWHLNITNDLCNYAYLFVSLANIVLAIVSLVYSSFLLKDHTNNFNIL